MGFGLEWYEKFTCGDCGHFCKCDGKPDCEIGARPGARNEEEMACKKFVSNEEYGW